MGCGVIFVSPIPVVFPVESRLLFLFFSFLLLQRLELLDGYLSEFDASGADTRGSQVQWQKKKNDPWKVTEEFPAGEDSKGESCTSRARYCSCVLLCNYFTAYCVFVFIVL